MKKYKYLGVNGKECCVLSSLLPFDALIPEEIEQTDFNHSCTNWCGRDTIDRTLTFISEDYKIGRKIILPKEIRYKGFDSDWGRQYDWSFVVKEIWELYEDAEYKDSL